jgi:hypothetical protein
MASIESAPATGPSDLDRHVHPIPARRPQPVRDEPAQPTPPSQRDHQGQTGTGHRKRVIEDHTDTKGSLRRVTSYGSPFVTETRNHP